MGTIHGRPDIIIKNGTIVDGTAAPPYYADIAIQGDTITHIGNLGDVQAPLIIDARGRLVTPGFIDVHSHSDGVVWANPECQSTIRQGVTTEVVGNCGFSGPIALPEGVTYDPAGDGVRSVYDIPEPPYPRGSLAAVLDKYDRMGAAMNMAWLCGHNDLRRMVGLYTPQCSKEQFAQMESWLREAMEAGFFGLSTGLEFVPGIVATPEEIEGLAAIAAQYDGIYTSHMRDEGTFIFEAVEEFLNVLRKTGMRGEISHLNVKYNNGEPENALRRSMQKVRDAREKEHLNVFADMLPTCYAAGGMLAILPPWVYEKGWDEARRILGDPEQRKILRTSCNRYWRYIHNGEWHRVSCLLAPHMPQINGMPFTELAKKWGKDEWDCFFDILEGAESFTEANNCHMLGQHFREQDMIDSVVTDPIYLWMADGRTGVDRGPLTECTRNPQYYMSITYFFAHYVRDLKCLPIERALPKITSIPARHFGIERRGLLLEGYYADINVFALEDLKIHATFQDPCQYSEGMDYVLVNGVPVIEKGEHTLRRPGRALRHRA